MEVELKCVRTESSPGAMVPLVANKSHPAPFGLLGHLLDVHPLCKPLEERNGLSDLPANPRHKQLLFSNCVIPTPYAA